MNRVTQTELENAYRTWNVWIRHDGAKNEFADFIRVYRGRKLGQFQYGLTDQTWAVIKVLNLPDWNKHADRYMKYLSGEHAYTLAKIWSIQNNGLDQVS